MAGRREHELLLKLSAELGSNFNSTFSAAIQSTNQLQGKVKEYKKVQGDITKYQKAEAAIKDLREEKARLESASGDNTAAIDRVNKELAVHEERLAAVSGSLQDAGIDTNNLSEESERLRREQEQVAKAQEDLAKATAAVNENSRQLTETKRALAIEIGKVTLAAAAIYKGAIQPAAQFQSSMSDIKAQTGMTAGEIEELGGIIREMGRDSVFGGQEIAEAYAMVAVRGQDVAHSSELMRTSMVLANATGEQLGGTAYFLGNYLLKIGKDVSYAESYMNVFAKTVQGTGIGLNTLQDYLFRANASLQMANISGVEATTIFGELYRAGVRGANAYTGFQQAIQSLMLPSDAAAAALDTLGINVQYMKAAGYDMTEIMFQVGDALEYVECGTERMALTTAMFTQQSAQAFTDELFNQRNVLRELIPEMYEVAGAAHGTGVAYTIAANRTDNFEAQMAKARNMVNDIRMSIGEALLPALNDLVGGLAINMQGVAEWANENQDLILTVTKVIGIISAAKIGYLALKTVILKVKGVVLAIKAAKAGYNAVVALMNTGTKMSTALKTKELAMTKKNTAAMMVAKGAVIAKTAADKIRKTISLGVTKAKVAETAAVKKSTAAVVKETAITKKSTIAKVAATIKQWALNAAKYANPIGIIILAIIALIGLIVALVKNWDTIVDAMKRVWEVVKDVFSKIWEFIKNVWENIKAAFAAAWERIKEIFSAVGGFFSGIWESITNVFSNVVGWFSERFSAAWEAIKSIFSAVKGFFTGIWDTITNIFTSIGTTIGNAIGSAFATVVNAIIGFAEGTINMFIRAINGAIGLINRIPGVSIGLLTELSIPRLYRGSNYTPDTFIAGDIRGKGGELITNAKGRKVFTAAETSNIFENIKAAMSVVRATPSGASGNQPTIAERVGVLINAMRSDSVSPPRALQPFGATGGRGGDTISFDYSPTIYVNGNIPDDLDEKLKQHGELMLQKFKAFLKQQQEDEGRMEFA